MSGPKAFTTSDDEFVRRFEACELAAGEFHHRDHVRLAWIYLRRHPPLEALGRFVASLKAFAAHHGAHGKYHETITWAYLLLINERMARGGRDEPWDAFEAGNPDLFDWSDSVLSRYYDSETLGSETARSTFVLPDRAGRPEPTPAPTSATT